MVSSILTLTPIPSPWYLIISVLMLFLQPRRWALSCPQPRHEDSWLDYRGICKTATVQALTAQIKGTKPDVVFLSETKANKNRMDYVKKFVKFDNSCVVEAKGYAGGLCIMWKNGLAIKEVEYDKNLIVVKVTDQSVEWILIGFYGPPYKSKKKKAWGNLFAFLESHQGPWTCIGDFNFIINDEEQFGGKKGGPSSTNYLKELLFELNAMDLGYSRNKLMWARGK